MIFVIWTLSSTPPAPPISRPAIWPLQQCDQHRRLVAEFLADGTARQRQRDAGGEIQADQDSDVGNADAEIMPEQRRDRGDALKLESHGEADHVQHGQNPPAIAQRLTPLEMAGPPVTVARRLSIVGPPGPRQSRDWHRDPLRIDLLRPRHAQSRIAEGPERKFHGTDQGMHL
jgi:hypothetical protein